MIKISKNENEEIRVFIEEFHGRQIFNARVFWKDRNGDWWPSKKGISFAVDKLTDFAEAVGPSFRATYDEPVQRRVASRTWPERIARFDRA